MSEELPNFTPLELELGSRTGKIAAPLINAGTEMGEALYLGSCQAAEQLKQEGHDPLAVDAALARSLAGRHLPRTSDPVHLSRSLHDLILKELAELVTREQAGAVRLDEKKVEAKTGYKMVLYPNESQHRGFPHVAVELQDGTINISLEEEPQVIAGTKGLRGEAAALKAVKKFRLQIIKEWDALRPDDQKLADGAGPSASD